MSDTAFYHIMLERFEPAPDEAFLTMAHSYAERQPREFQGVMESYFVPNRSPDAGQWPHLRWMKFDTPENRFRFKYSDHHSDAVRDLVPRMRFVVGDLDMTRANGKPVRARRNPGEVPYCQLLAFKPKAYVPPAVLDAAAKEALRIRNAAAGVLEYFFEANIAPFQHDWHFIVLSRFTSEAAFRAFQATKDAGAIAALMAPYTEESVRGELLALQDKG